VARPPSRKNRVRLGIDAHENCQNEGIPMAPGNTDSSVDTTSNEKTNVIFRNVVEYVRETKLLGSVNALLEWDQQTMLPSGASEYRSQQITYLAGKLHQRETDPALGDWLGELSESDLAADPHSDSGSTIRELLHRYRKRSQLPIQLVQKQASLHSRGQQIWIQARKSDDFESFRETLDEIFRLKREEAQAVTPMCGTADCLYDALLDDYEPGAKTVEVADALAQLRDALIPLIARANEHRGKTCGEVLTRTWPVSQQTELVKRATAAIGFDYQRGRLDIAHHPFCTETGPHDVRMTTRYDERMFNSAFFGSLHEAGHGMYEQGLPGEQYGLPPGCYCSLGIHESQSRLWENLVGRSAGFWEHFFPQARDLFPQALGDVSQSRFLRDVNEIKPSLIRVEADEATYNMHIIIRFELEQDLLEQRLRVADLPAAWNEKYRQYLGIEPPGCADGVLQDIHWSAGLIGYFSTYSLGNIYASMLFQKAESDLGSLEDQFAKGDFKGLLHWLSQSVHRRGNRYRANELMQKVTGAAIDHRPLIDHLQRKVDTLVNDKAG